MKKELDEKLVKAFPLLYADRNGDKRSTAMCWGFSCRNGWFDIIWNLSEKLEAIIKEYVDNNLDLECYHCGCKKEKHYGSKTKNPGKCLAIHINPYSKECPPGNYYACHCDRYLSNHPRAAQVKEKFGGLRFYMTSGDDEIYQAISEAETLSHYTCEECGNHGKKRDLAWIRTLCDNCYNEWEEIRKKEFSNK